jgi:hypothetical protein
MITDKKNQHYIPKFYLRNFSYKNNKKQIGVFNINNELYIQRAKLKTQGSKNFFYGYDGEIEDSLANIEGKLSNAIKTIIENREIPKKETPEHIDLLTFVVLTDLRNPVRINGMKNMFNEMEKSLLSLAPETDTKKLVPEMTHNELVKLSLSNIPEIIWNITDLDFKLLINKTKYPFITSDYPIVKYNQFLEQKKWQQSKSGYGVIGLEIFIPITSKIIIVFFDNAIYKVGNKKQKLVDINDKNDVDQLNILQLINCFENVFFNEYATEHYIRSIFEKSKKYKRANVAKAKLSYIIKEGEDEKKVLLGKQNLMIMNSTDCEIKLNINNIKIHSKGKHYKLNASMAQLRKHPEKLRVQEDLLKKAANKKYSAFGR